VKSGNLRTNGGVVK